MTRHRSTSLRYFIKHCPASLAFYERGAPMDRDLFAAGIAAHAVLQALGEAANAVSNADPQTIADAVLHELIAHGRSFDGVHEPPLPPDAAVEGRDLALRWARENPPRSSADYEIGLAIDAGGNACTYDSPHARYVGILDALHWDEAGDEEYSARTLVHTDFKSAWPTDASELDTLQMRGQTVLVDANYCNLPEPPDLIVRRVVNLRTMQTFEAAVSPVEDRELIDQWKRDILTLCDAADETREARPGAGCAGCPWAHCCDDAWREAANGREVAMRYAVAQALRDDLAKLARMACKDSPVAIIDGTVGYAEKPARSVAPDAYRALAETWHSVLPDDADEWAAHNARWLGLLSSLDLGVTQVAAAAKVLHPERTEKAAREEFIESLTTPTIRREFGVWRS